MTGDESHMRVGETDHVGPPPVPAPGWWLFQGDGTPLDPAERDRRWPPPPPWRTFAGGPDLPTPPEDEAETRRRLGRRPSVLLDPDRISIVNAAIYLRRPLLVMGSPGSGKSALAHLIARELGLGRVLHWPITSRTALRTGLADYDAIGRAQAALAMRGAPLVRRYARSRPEEGWADRAAGAPSAAVPPVGDFVHLGPLGTALLPYARPRVLLIDELDKSDFDLPNDLLNVLEEGMFTIPELVRVQAQSPSVEVHTADPGGRAVVRDGIVRCHAFPIIVITSNGEREFPPAFLRRCSVLEVPEPDGPALAALVAAHFPDGVPDVEGLVERFGARRAAVGPLAADQLLNAAYLASAGALEGDPAAWGALLDGIWHQLVAGPDAR